LVSTFKKVNNKQILEIKTNFWIIFRIIDIYFDRRFYGL